jgi:putative transposase
MARPLRFAPAGVPLHVWCRGNQQQTIFNDETDRRRYHKLLIQHCLECGVDILGYCQMTNHVHLILRPNHDEGISDTMQRINSDYAQGVQLRLGRKGHLWQGRYRAAAMDDAYLWNALRYVELNPVRAGLVTQPEDWAWSSAAAHCGVAPWPEWLEWKTWASRFHSSEWRAQLRQGLDLEETARIRQATRRNRPLAKAETISKWEQLHAVILRPERPGRKVRKSPASALHSQALVMAQVG